MKKVLILFGLILSAWAVTAQTPYDTVNVYDPQAFTEMTTIDPANAQVISRKNNLNRRINLDTLRKWITPDILQPWAHLNFDTTGNNSAYWDKFVSSTDGTVWFIDSDGDGKLLHDTEWGRIDTAYLSGSNLILIENGSDRGTVPDTFTIALTSLSISDGDKGDIDVTGSGATWNIDTSAVGANEIASTAVTPASYTLTNLTVDADGRITSASNGTDPDFAANGLTMSGDSVILGGSLNKNTTITGGNYGLVFSRNSSGNVLWANNSSTGNAILASATSAIGVYGQATTGYGVTGYATGTGTGVQAWSDNGTALDVESASALESTTKNLITIVHQTSDTAQTGFGTDISLYLESASGTTRQTSYLRNKWTTATDATRTSSFEIGLVNSAALGRKLGLAGNGQLTLDGYANTGLTSTDSSLYVITSDETGDVWKRSISGLGSDGNGLISALPAGDVTIDANGSSLTIDSLNSYYIRTNENESEIQLLTIQDGTQSEIYVYGDTSSTFAGIATNDGVNGSDIYVYSTRVNILSDSLDATGVTTFLGFPDTDSQTLSLSNDSLTISGGNTVDLGYMNDSIKWNAINRTGFVNAAETTIAFDSGTKVFTLGDVGAGWSYFRGGRYLSFTGNKTIDLDTLSTTLSDGDVVYIFIDNDTGTLGMSETVWTLTDQKLPVAIILWNNTLYNKYWMGDERHQALMDRRTHYYLHVTRGAQVISGGVPADYSVAPVSPANDDNTFSITETTIADEDLIEVAAELTDPAGTDGEGDYIVFYHSSGNWVWDTSDMAYPWAGGSYIQYDNGTNLVTGQNSRFYNSYLLYSNFDGEARYIMIPGRSEFSTAAAAYAENPLAFTWTGFPIKEAIVAYQFTFSTNVSYGNKGKCRLTRDPQRINATVTTVAVPTSIVYTTSPINGSGTIGSPVGMADGDYGDVDVTGGGVTWAVDTSAVGTLEVTDNSLTASDLSVNVASSVDGVTNDGGDIDLVQGSNITITPNDGANTITIAATDAQTVSTSRDSITLSGSSSTVRTPGVGFLRDSITGAALTIDLKKYGQAVVEIRMEACTSTTLTVNNPWSSTDLDNTYPSFEGEAGVYTFHFLGISGTDNITWPAAFLDMNGTALGTDALTTGTAYTCYYNPVAAKYYCK